VNQLSNTPVPESRHGTAFGGLRRLGTVMNRRKSVALPSGGPSEKKYRSPFSFKRADSRDMQIPEDARTERPGTALTSQDSYTESTRVQSESNERESHDRVSASPVPPQSPPGAVNGLGSGFTSQESPAGAGTNEVCFAAVVWIQKLMLVYSHEWIRKGSRNGRK
jgi:hypothetical protein